MNDKSRLQPNTTQVPNIILDDFLPLLSDTEFKIIMVIARQTYGWHKSSDRISYTQLEKKTGSSHKSIANALKSLKDKDLIETTAKGQNLYYSIKTSVKNTLVENLHQTSVKNTLATSVKITLTKETNTKETIQKKESIERNEQSLTKVSSLPLKYSTLEELTQLDFQEIAERYHVPLAFVLSEYEDMCLWAGTRPGNPKLKGRNWRLTLMAWVKRDGLKIMERSKGDLTKRSIDARNL